MRDGQGTRTGKERNRHGQGKYKWRKAINKYGIIFAFVYHTSFLLFLLFRNTQWDGTTMQEKNKGHAQGKEGINSDKGSTSGRRL